MKNLKVLSIAGLEGEGLIAGLASKLRTEEDVRGVMTKLVKEYLETDTKNIPTNVIRTFEDKYARLFFDHSKIPEAKAALEKYFIKV